MNPDRVAPACQRCGTPAPRGRWKWLDGPACKGCFWFVWQDQVRDGWNRRLPRAPDKVESSDLVIVYPDGTVAERATGKVLRGPDPNRQWTLLDLTYQPTEEQCSAVGIRLEGRVGVGGLNEHARRDGQVTEAETREFRRRVLFLLAGEQGNLCGQCAKPADYGGFPRMAESGYPIAFSLMLDHDHSSGRVRAALCHGCNFRAGQ